MPLTGPTGQTDDLTEGVVTPLPRVTLRVEVSGLTQVQGARRRLVGGLSAGPPPRRPLGEGPLGEGADPSVLWTRSTGPVFGRGGRVGTLGAS